jgi:hypothetical protein
MSLQWKLFARTFCALIWHFMSDRSEGLRTTAMPNIEQKVVPNNSQSDIGVIWEIIFRAPFCAL